MISAWPCQILLDFTHKCLCLHRQSLYTLYEFAMTKSLAQRFTQLICL